MKTNGVLILCFLLAMAGVVILVAGSRDDPGGTLAGLVPLGRILLFGGLLLGVLGVYFLRGD